MAVLGFRLPPEGLPVLDLAEEELKFMPYGWCLCFAAALTVSVTPHPARKNPGFIPRVFLASDSPALPLMARGKFQCVFYDGNTPVRFCEVNFGDRLKIEVNNVLTHKAPLYRSDDALFWQIVDALKDSPGLREYLRPEERLSRGWQRDYRHTVKFFLQTRDEMMTH